MPKGHSLIGAYNAQMMRYGAQRVQRASSSQSLTWKFVPIGGSGVVAIHFNGTYWVAVTNAGDFCYTRDPTIVKSPSTTDGWQLSTAILGASLSSVYYGSGFWVVGGNTSGTPSVYYTTDGSFVTWKALALSSLAPAASSVNSVFYGNSRWVVVTNNSYVLHTSDIESDPADTDTTWRASRLSVTTRNLGNVRFGGGYWLLGDDVGSVWYSDDPFSGWTQVTLSSYQIKGIQYDSANGKWVVLDNNATIWTATNPTDLANWSSYKIPSTTIVNSLDYGAGEWRIGQDNSILTATNPTIAWTSEIIDSSATSPIPKISCANYGSGKWVIGDRSNFGIWYK